MGNKLLGKCPVCQHKMDVIRLHCPECDTSVEGKFDSCKFCQMNAEQKAFVEVFLKARGNIKEVERELGISYPTVRSRLDSVIEALGYKPEPADDNLPKKRKDILEALENGSITAEEATRLLKQL